MYSEAGGGHASSAQALACALERRGAGWSARLTNLQKILEPIDLTKRLIGLRVEDTYNRMLQKGWTLGHPFMFRLGQKLIRLHEPAASRILEGWWRERSPGLAVSMLPNFNKVLFESLQRVCPGVPFVTILTDFADCPPHAWIEPQDQYVICGTPRARDQALALGTRPDHLFLASGMILSPAFYEQASLDRGRERERLGLRQDLPTGIVLFGGQGSAAMRLIVRRLDRSGLDIQLILICGRNEGLATELRAARARMPLLVVGFTDRIPWYMALSDFMIGKPGPGSISEAVAMRLPVIVDRNARTLLQERYNAEWVMEHGVGIVIPSFRRIASAVADLLDPPTYRRLKAATEAIRNRAVSEVAELLERIALDPVGREGRSMERSPERSGGD